MDRKENLSEAYLIDFKNIGSIPLSEFSDDVFKNLAKEFVDKIKTTGYVGLKNHGLPLNFVQNLNESFETFFDLPSNVKYKYIKDMQTMQGYTDETHENIIDKDLKKFDVKRSFDMANLSESLFPKEVPELRVAAISAVDALTSFTEKILRLLDEGLGLDSKNDNLLSLHQKLLSGFTTLKVLSYPKVPDDIPAGAIRFGEHRDIATISLLFHDKIGGFQILQDEFWKNVNFDPNIIHLLLGSTAIKVTGGRLAAAAKHRVVVADNEHVFKSARTCVGFFVHPAPDAILKNLFDPSEKGIINRKFLVDSLLPYYKINK